jgi:hypothetical protein
MNKPSKTVKRVVEQQRKNWEAWKTLHANLPQRA